MRQPILRSTTLFAGATLAAVLCTAPAQDTLPRVKEIGRTPGGKVTFTVESDPESYHVLRRSRSLSSSSGRAVAVVPGEVGVATIIDSVLPQQQAFYRIETYSNAEPGDLDGDQFSDLVEYRRGEIMNPLNPAPPISRIDGGTHIPSRSVFERLSHRENRPGAQAVREVKFVVYNLHTRSPELYFVNSNRYLWHYNFTNQALGRYPSLSQFNADSYFNNATRKNVTGSLVSHDHYVGPDGARGVYSVEFHPPDPVAFRFVETAYELVAAAMPFVDGNLAYHPASETQRAMLETERIRYDNSHVNIISTEELFANLIYTGLNEAESYGRLRLVTGNETLSLRDIVIFRTIPNDLTHVSGIITEIPQTPLSHINLKAKQNDTPNAYIRDASTHPEIAPLIGQNVYYRVDSDGFEIRAATQEEVESWFESIRPTETQLPVRNLGVTRIHALARVEFDDADAFGSKASNLAELHRIMPNDTPDGYAVPFYFYDEFMKYNRFYQVVEAMIADPEFQSSPSVRDSRLKSFRKSIKNGSLPLWMYDALDAMHQSFPEGTTLRARSSTNNEDLEGFNGAGLYSSYTHHLDEGHFQKSARQVWASLWNYRAYEEREFWRIDHFRAAMGILIHPNYGDEVANGVGVTKNIFESSRRGNYINVQVGEDLVTNPEAESIPEEFLIALLGGTGQDYEIQYIRFSNQVPAGETILTRTQALELKDRMNQLHTHFGTKYGIFGGNQNWAMEIEFKITADGALIIKQARPWVD